MANLLTGVAAPFLYLYRQGERQRILATQYLCQVLVPQTDDSPPLFARELVPLAGKPSVAELLDDSRPWQRTANPVRREGPLALKQPDTPDTDTDSGVSRSGSGSGSSSGSASGSGSSGSLPAGCAHLGLPDALELDLDQLALDLDEAPTTRLLAESDHEHEHNSTMGRKSTEARRRKPESDTERTTLSRPSTTSTSASPSLSMSASTSTSGSMPPPALPLPQHLDQATKYRPASPPKVNPWKLKPSNPQPDDHSFPPLPNEAAATAAKAKKVVNRTSRAASESASSTRVKSQPQVALTEPAPLVSSNGSRHIFEAAAPRARETLWKHPFGADVIAYAEGMTFRLHRNIIEAESGWFRDNLPPPNDNGSPVEVWLDCAAAAAGHCLRFLYSEQLELCDINRAQPWHIIHLPRCALTYCAAAYLRIGKLAKHLLRIVETTATELGTLSADNYHHRDLSLNEWTAFSWCFSNVFDIIYHHGPQRLMKPMRMAVASVLDATLFWMLQHPMMLGILRTTWHIHLPNISADHAEYRVLRGRLDANVVAGISDQTSLNQLFDQAESSEFLDMPTSYSTAYDFQQSSAA
ncbi:hypothetical protein G7046_g3303 [Stylonectria norvegica]|nr:hypothetical protein G7046_g3303 [Stylonectria norvegica]